MLKRERKKRPSTDGTAQKRRQSFLPVAIGVSGGIALSTLAFWYFKERAEDVVSGEADPFDWKVLQAVRSTQNHATDHVMHAITTLGTHPAIGTAAALTALAMMRQKKPHEAWTVLISTGGAMALNSFLKAIFQRQRPQDISRRIRLPKSHSFPSGHSLLSAATYPIVAHHLVQHRSSEVQIAAHAAAGFLIVSVGYSRIYFGVHFPSDVLAGFAAGLGWLGLTSLSHSFVDEGIAREPKRATMRRAK